MTEFNRYLTRAEEKTLFSTISKTAGVLAARDLLWMKILRNTGIRISAFSQLTVGDAQAAIRDGRLYLRAEIQKRGQPHSVPVTKPTARHLKALLKIRRDMGHAPDLDAPLVMSRNHQRMSVRTYQHRVAQWCKKAGLPPASPHWFRHTLAKRTMADSTATDPRAIVASMLGHSQIKSTEVYTRPDKEAVSAAFDAASV